MDYSELVYAIKNGDQRTTNKLCGEALPILKKYLISKVDASPENAEDAVQRMFEYVIPKIKNDEINSPSGLLSYMLTGARHSYYKIVEKFDTDDLEEIRESFVSEPEQAWRLISQDHQAALKVCLDKLKEHYRDLMVFLFSHPNADSEDIAEHFGISLNNAWIRKHRAVQMVSDCVKEFFTKN